MSLLDTACQSLIKMIGKKSRIERVWTNASPSSTFREQVIALELPEGSFVDITFRAQSDKASTFVTRIPVGKTQDGAGMGSVSVYRPTTVSTNGVAFGQGRCYTSYNSSNLNTSDNYCIPIAIDLVSGGGY